MPLATHMLLSATDLSLGYGNKAIAENVTFKLASGEKLAIVGHNGSGKSTLIKTLLETLPPLEGTLNWHNGRPKPISYLGQMTEFDSKFPIRVRDIAAMGAWSDLGLLGRIDSACKARISDALKRSGIADIADMPLHKLSVGQLQRALFARTMVQDAQLILLDEPFTAVDQTTETALMELINNWAAEGRSIILVFHDLSTVLQHCNSVLLLGGGGALFGPPKETLTLDNLIAHRYVTQSQRAWIEEMYVNSEKHDV